MEPDETRPYLIDGWLMLPDTADHFAAMIRADDVHFVQCQFGSEDEDDISQETVVVLCNFGGGGKNLHVATDVEFYDELCTMVRDAKGE